MHKKKLLSAMTGGKGQNQEVLKAIESLKNENNITMKKNQSELVAKFEALEAKFNELKKNYDLVVADNKALRTEVKALSVMVNVARQENLQRNLLIRGLKEVEGSSEELKSNVLKIFEKIQPAFPVSNILNVERIGKKRDTGFRIVLVELTHASMRDQLLMAKKKVVITNADIGAQIGDSADERDKIFFAEHLTKENLNLLSMARDLRENGMKFVWVKRGKIFARAEEGAQQYRIWSSTDVAVLERKYGKRSGKRNATSSPMLSDVSMGSPSKQNEDVDKVTTLNNDKKIRNKAFKLDETGTRIIEY